MFQKMEVKLLIPFLILASMIVVYILLSWCPTSVEYASQRDQSFNKRTLIMLSSQLSSQQDINIKEKILREVFKSNQENWRKLSLSENEHNILTIRSSHTTMIEPVTLTYKTEKISLLLTYDFSLTRQKIEQHAAKLAMLIMGAIVTFSTLLWFATRHYIIKPVRRLVRMSDALAKGEYHNTALSSSDGEIGQLITSFVSMRHKLAIAKNKQEKQLDKITNLARQNLLMAKIVKESALGIMIIDCKKENLPIAYINTSLDRMTGYSFHDLTGQEYITIFNVDRHTEEFYDIEQSIETGKNIKTELQVQHKNGYLFWVTLNGFPIYNNDGDYRAYSFTIENIEERKQIETMKDGFISTVSHELRTPLTSVHGSLSLLNGNLRNKVAEEVLPVIDIAYKNSNLLTRLVDDILNIEKLDSGTTDLQYEETQITHILKDAITLTRPYAAQFNVNIAFNSNIPENFVLLDKQKMTQVFSNILSNAIKFSSPQSIVNISAYLYEKNYIRIEFKDQGCGIPRHLHNKIFNKFVRGDTSNVRKTEGTGLGLYITKSIVAQHNGSISFNSTQGVGTSFYIDIPILQQNVTRLKAI